MILYLSGLKTAAYVLPLSRPPNVLTSYLEKWDVPWGEVGKVFLDSGAFTAFNLGTEIDLDEYIENYHRTKGSYETVAALDVIGNWQQSRLNYEEMRKQGCDVLPTYHVGEPLSFLEWLLANYNYVAIGGLVPYVSMTSKRVYSSALKRIFAHVHKEAANAGVRLHGFGVTGWDIMSGYPWYSVDSTTYLSGSKFARPIYFHKGKMGGSSSPGGYARASLFARRHLGLDFAPEDIPPKKGSGGAAERYMNILKLNCETMLYAEAVLSK